MGRYPELNIIRFGKENDNECIIACALRREVLNDPLLLPVRKETLKLLGDRRDLIIGQVHDYDKIIEITAEGSTGQFFSFQDNCPVAMDKIGLMCQNVQ